MKQVLVLLAVICSAYGAWEGGLRIKFNVGLRPGYDFFFPMPRTVAAAISEGWNVTERATSHLPSLSMYCPSDRIVCALYDTQGAVAGLQISYGQDDISGSTLDWPTQGFVEWTTTTGDGASKTFWTTVLYLVSEETLRMTKEERDQAFGRNDVLSAGAIWVSGFNGELVKISSKAEDVANSIFTRQACIPWMGRHYYYNMTSEAQCTSDTLFPWFPIVHSGELIAVGLIAHGKRPTKDNEERDWYERPNKLAVQAIVPDGPECLYKMADLPGIVTMHIYFVEQPWWIGCLEN